MNTYSANKTSSYKILLPRVLDLDITKWEFFFYNIRYSDSLITVRSEVFVLIDDQKMIFLFLHKINQLLQQTDELQRNGSPIAFGKKLDISIEI